MLPCTCACPLVGAFESTCVSRPLLGVRRAPPTDAWGAPTTACLTLLLASLALSQPPRNSALDMTGHVCVHCNDIWRCSLSMQRTGAVSSSEADPV